MLLSSQRIIIKGKEAIFTGDRVCSATSIRKPGYKPANVAPDRRKSKSGILTQKCRTITGVSFLVAVLCLH